MHDLRLTLLFRGHICMYRFRNCPKIYHNFQILFNLWTDKTIHGSLCKTCVINLKKNNLYFQLIFKLHNFSWKTESTTAKWMDFNKAFKICFVDLKNQGSDPRTWRDLLSWMPRFLANRFLGLNYVFNVLSVIFA